MSAFKPDHDRSLLDSLSRALRPIPYWIGYKREKYWSHELPEAAVVAELRETLMLAFGRDKKVRCEVPYSEFGGSKIKVASNGRPQQADLGIFLSNRLHSQKPLAVIEVKRGHSKGSIKSDVKKLATLAGKKHSPCRRFIVLISERRIPRFDLTKGKSRHAGRLVNFKFEDARFKDVSVSVRRKFKAIGSTEKKPKKRNPKYRSQHWVVLFEVK